MGLLRVGVHQVPAAEAGLVRAWVQLLCASSRDFGWVFATEAPYDALIVSAEGLAGDGAELRNTARAVSVLGGDCDSVAGVEILARPLQSERLESWLAEVRQRLQACSGDVVDAPRYKLRRWPPSALLHADPLRLRMATLLSRRAMTAAELSRVSGVRREQSQTFVHLLQGFDLVEVRHTPPPPAATVAAVAPRRGLVQSIRARLGLA